ncbi:MAG: rRNA maturation RNase YbeY [Bacteroidia bacterium]|nr:rRNA maturation RNase YbeY [Bacteroidia bacterium]
MIDFVFHEVEKPHDFDANAHWLIESANTLFPSIAYVQYVFCTDEHLLELNRSSLNHDYYTDIITFDLRDTSKDALEAELYISLDRIKDNATRYSCTFAEEIRRVMIHGLLHLNGLNDSTDEEKTNMRRMENKFLETFK